MTGPEHRSTFASTAGGVMTDEAGAITGELELLCRPEAGVIRVLVRYAGADDWYTVSGGPVRTQRESGSIHERILQHLRTPGPVVGGNERPVSLDGFSGA